METNLFNITAVAFICIFVLLSVFFIFILLHDKKIREKNDLFLKQENRLISAIVKANETEREKIARDIHDELGMLIHTLRLKLDLSIEEISTPERAAIHMKDCTNIFEKITKSLRNISGTLHPSTLINFGLIAGCNYLADEINCNGIHAVEIKSETDSLNLDPEHNQQLYFTIKELVSNIIKHSDASYTEIEFKSHNNDLEICLHSNAPGPSNEDIQRFLSQSSGHGLKSIFGRLSLINGKIDFTNDSNKHSNIKISLRNEQQH